VDPDNTVLQNTTGGRKIFVAKSHLKRNNNAPIGTPNRAISKASTPNRVSFREEDSYVDG
jgi:hypothetical protein